jgi:hypothetical protein
MSDERRIWEKVGQSPERTVIAPRVGKPSAFHPDLGFAVAARTGVEAKSFASVPRGFDFPL